MSILNWRARAEWLDARCPIKVYHHLGGCLWSMLCDRTLQQCRRSLKRSIRRGRWSVTRVLCDWWSQVGLRRPLQGAMGLRRVLAGLRGAGPGVHGTPGTCHRMGPLLGPSHHHSPLSPIPRSPTPTRTPLARRVSQAQSNKLFPLSALSHHAVPFSHSRTNLFTLTLHYLFLYSCFLLLS